VDQGALVSFTAAVGDDREMSVNEIPTTEMPTALRAAHDALEEREREVLATESAVESAREAVTAAHERDVEAIASAREGGRPDPRSTHEEKARSALVGAERDAEIMRAHVAAVRAEYERVGEEQRPRWKQALEKEWAKVDSTQRRRARELAAGFDRQRELRATWLFVDAVLQGDADAATVLRKARAPSSSAAPDLSDVLDAIEQSSCESVTARIERERRERSEREEAAQREWEQQLAEARRAQVTG
jgi:hypothetical protein